MKAFLGTVITKEEMVREFLINRGFQVSRSSSSENANGIDITAIKDGRAFLIEVKAVVRSTRSMVVKRILKSGLMCNFIAIVTPKNNIIFQPMSEHLKLCNKSGSRSVTDLVRIYDSI